MPHASNQLRKNWINLASAGIDTLREKLTGIRMANLTFQSIVLENNQIGTTETISSISEAEAFLLTGWPKKKSSLHLEARVACYEAQSGIVSVDAARSIFMEAAIEADIYVREEHPALLHVANQNTG